MSPHRERWISPPPPRIPGNPREAAPGERWADLSREEPRERCSCAARTKCGISSPITGPELWHGALLTTPISRVFSLREQGWIFGGNSAVFSFQGSIFQESSAIHSVKNHLSFSQMKWNSPSHFLLSGKENPNKSETPNLSQLKIFLLNPTNLGKKKKNPLLKNPILLRRVGFCSWRNQ